MMFFNVPFFVSNQDGLNGCYYTSWIAQWIEIISEIAFLLQPDTVPAKEFCNRLRDVLTHGRPASRLRDQLQPSLVASVLKSNLH